MINHIVKNPLPITYQKVKVPNQKFGYKQFIKADLKGFNAKIGSITNNSSCMFGMLPMFKGDLERESIIKERIRILRKLIGNSIDAAKGVEYIPFPKDWKAEYRILPNDDPETIKKKRRHNSMNIRKKPYFMTYIYPKLKQEYMAYKKSYDFLSKVNFGCDIKTLIERKDKGEKEIKFLSRYNYFSPVLNTNCVMNMLCKSVESVDFDFKFYKTTKEETFDHSFYLLNDPFNTEMYKQVENVLRKTKKQYLRIIELMREKNVNNEDIKMEVGYSATIVFEDCEKQLMEVLKSKKTIADYAIDIAYKRNDFVYKNIVWAIFGKEIVRRLSEGKTYAEIPMVSESEDGEHIYGKNLKLIPVFSSNYLIEDTNIDFSSFDIEEDYDLGDLDYDNIK